MGAFTAMLCEEYATHAELKPPEIRPEVKARAGAFTAMLCEEYSMSAELKPPELRSTAAVKAATAVGLAEEFSTQVNTGR